MIRFIFYLAFGYVILKILRVFIDPFFEGNARQSRPGFTPPPAHEEKKPPLGDYVDFEEVK